MTKKQRSPYTINLNVQEGYEGYNLLCKCPPPPGLKNLQQLEVSMTKSIGSGSIKTPTLTIAQQNAIAAKRNKMAMSIGMSPGQALAMNALMLWFSGSQLNIFSITTTSSAILTPLTNLLNIENAFRQFVNNDVDVQIPKLSYIAINLAWLCIGLYKMSSMRLLPTTSADWTYKITWKEMMETTSIPPDNSLFY